MDGKPRYFLTTGDGKTYHPIEVCPECARIIDCTHAQAKEVKYEVSGIKDMRFASDPRIPEPGETIHVPAPNKRRLKPR